MSVLSRLLLRGYNKRPLTRCYQPPTHLARGRGWRHEPRKAAAAGLLAYSSVFLLPYAVTLLPCRMISYEEVVPYTNRVHRVFLDPSQERDCGDSRFDEIKRERGEDILGPSDPSTVRVRGIADDIIRGIHHLLLLPNSPSSDEDPSLKCRGPNKPGKVPQTADLSELNWEVIVVRDKRANASCRRGGKITVNTGLLERFDTDAEIATVLAHEVGHAVARHSLELHGVVGLLNPVLSRLLPFSRRNEVEADQIGIMLLAAAGFDPRVAPGVYQKQGETGGNSPWDDYTGSHPSATTRSRLLSQSKAMKDAVELYNARGGSN